jgi:hypothetical protein
MQAAPNIRTVAHAADAANVLLRDLIDYAGLFPPASLTMPESMANYAAYSRSERNWILGRFIIPVSRLGEFEEAFTELPGATRGIGLTVWRLSVLLGSDAVSDIARICEFNAREIGASSGRSAVIESVEVKAAAAGQVQLLAQAIPTEFATYFEIPVSDWSECIRAVANCGRRAKIRTGGETADKFPSSESVLEFIRQCAAANVPFKATAGLHHPLRSVHGFTYQTESLSGMMHGFLNVFLAAAFLRAGMEIEFALQLLEEKSAQEFRFALDGIEWRQHRLSRDEIASARRNFAVSFGSCSFTEPIDDLQALHLL